MGNEVISWGRLKAGETRLVFYSFHVGVDYFEKRDCTSEPLVRSHFQSGSSKIRAHTSYPKLLVDLRTPSS